MLTVADKLYEIVVEIQFLLIESAFVVIKQAEKKIRAVELAEVGIRRVADDDGEAFVAFDFVDGGGFVGEGVEVGERRGFLPGFEGVGEVDAGAFFGAEAVSGLGELEADFHVGDGVGGHHEFEGVQSCQKMLGDIAVPIV